MDVAVAAAGDRRLAAVRAWWRVRHPPPSLGRRLDVAYTAAITVAILGAVAYGTAGSALAEVLTPARLETFGPPAALVGLVLIARWGAYQGPVVFTVADVGVPARRAAAAPGPGRATPRARAATGMAAGAALAGGADRRPRRRGPGHRRRRRRRAHRRRRGAGRARRRGRVGGGALGALGARVRAWATWPAIALAAALAAWGPAGPVARRTRSCSHGRDGAGGRRRAARLRALPGGAPSAPRRGAPERRRLARRYDFRTARRSLEATAPRSTPSRGRRRCGACACPRCRGATRSSAVRAPGRVAEAALLAAPPLPCPCRRRTGRSWSPRRCWPATRRRRACCGRCAPSSTCPTGRACCCGPPIGRIMLEHTARARHRHRRRGHDRSRGVALAGEASAAPALVAVALAPLLTLCAAMSARRGGRLPQSLLVTAMAADPTGGGIHGAHLDRVVARDGRRARRVAGTPRGERRDGARARLDRRRDGRPRAPGPWQAVCLISADRRGRSTTSDSIGAR